MTKRKRHGDYDLPSPPAKKQNVASNPLPEGIQHYSQTEEVPQHLLKYWHQGYQIFSRYDEGIWMTDDAWFSVTHENVANQIAQHVATAAPDDRSIIIDAFAGVGGNSIAFALSGKWKRVYAIEKDWATLECAKHNAEIYGVADKITWFHGDCFELLGCDENKKEKAVDALTLVIQSYGVLFASPPWGGPGYKDANVFDLQQMEPYALEYLFNNFNKVCRNMALYLPRTSDLRQIAYHVQDGKTMQVVNYSSNGRSHAICVYFGEWKSVFKD